MAKNRSYGHEKMKYLSLGLSKSEIAKRLGMGQTTVKRILSAQVQELSC